MFKKLFGNLAVDFGLLLFLAVIVSVFSLIGMMRMEADYQLLIEHDYEIERLAAKIETDLLHMANLEEDFLLHMEEQGFESAYEHYVVRHNDYTQAIKDDTAELLGIVKTNHVERMDDQAVIDDIEEINADIAEYEVLFEELLELLEERGTTTSGLEGDFRDKAAEIEVLLKKHEGALTLQLSLMELRLAEENYLLHRSRENAEQVIFWYHELFGEVDDSEILTRREKSEIETLLDTYDTDFETVVVMDEQIKEIEGEIRLIYDDVERLALHIADLGQLEASEEIAHATTQSALTLRVVITCIIVVLIFGVGLTLAMSKKMREFEKDI